MSRIQRFFITVLPKSWAAAMQADSERWKMRCCTCGWTQSYWEAGGIRWKAVSKGKRIMIRCANCEQIRVAAVEKV